MGPRGRSTVARRLARVPAAVWAVTVAVGALAAAWSLDAWSGWPDGGAVALVAAGAIAVVALVVVAGRDARAGAAAPVRSGTP